MRKPLCSFRWVVLLCTASCLLACENAPLAQSTPISSAAVAPAAPSERNADIAPPITSAAPSVSAMADLPPRGLYGASVETLENALRKVGWTPIGHRVTSFIGVECRTVLAKRDGQVAEVKSFYGYPYQLGDMLELKGTAQGLGEMTMITVIVKGDPAKTDELYMQLMGSPPQRHGTGRGMQ